MIVLNSQPFALVYTFVNHKYLGYLLQPHVVQKNSNGNFTLTHQRVYAKTTEYFGEHISPSDLKIISILDKLDENLIYKLYFDDGKKKVRASEFFEKQTQKSDQTVKDEVRHYIDNITNEALELLKGSVVYKTGNDNNPTSQKLEVSSEKASILFHFRRDEEGTRYFPTIKHKGARIEFMYKGASIVSTYPAWMILESQLISFEKGVDGKKLQPFLNKRFIQIPKSSEENYFTKFITHLVEKYDVYAEGFNIVTEKHYASTCLKIQPDATQDLLTVNLSFKYGDAEFDYMSANDVTAIVSKEKDSYTFKRIRRNRKWEDGKREVLEKMGLHQVSGSLFTVITRDIATAYNQTLLPLSATNKYQFLEWVNDYKNLLQEQKIEIVQSDELSKYFFGSREIKVEIKESKDWFDVKATVYFGEFAFPFLALKNNILSGKREFLLPNGQVAVIPEEWFGRLGAVIELSRSDDELQLEKHHVGVIQELLNDSSRYLNVSEKLSRIKNYGDIKDFELPSNFSGILRPYQKAGFDWFYFLKENNFGGCLADDMGLGKTIQTLALLQKEKELYTICKTYASPDIQNTIENTLTHELKPQLSLFDGESPTTGRPDMVEDEQTNPQHESTQLPEGIRTFIRTSLIVVPNSLVFNWYQEARKFTPDLKVLVYTGIQRIKDPQLFSLYDLVISTYGTVRVDVDILSNYKFNYIILDESQSIKNPNSLSSRAVKRLKASHKLVLTGTPIENGIHELWSQLSFINPSLLGSLSSFTERFINPIEKNKDQHKMAQLRAIIKPFVLRRTKDQVAKELPSKIEQIKFCNMTEEQAEAYEKTKSFYRNEIIKSIQDLGLGKSQFAILQGLTKLRQIANHPKLSIADYDGQAGKYDEITAMIETAYAEGHKVLLFSQFVKQLDIYKSYLDEKAYAYCYLDGSVQNIHRQQQVDEFQKNESIKFFLISLKAGGVGLNLTAADYVFIIDPWWNPAVEQQAIDRTHRIGQDKTVFIYKFITKDTVEEKILALQDRKKELANTIITTEESFIKTIDVDEILEILS
ncbi:MAG: DEAD/DEAH box helicase [Bacteroidota bacterium]